jgi:hypothetical protein
MAKRGKVLRDANAGPGLLMVEGKQYPFGLEGVWKSDVPAKPGLVVDVDFDGNDQVTGITAVPESQLAREQAEAAMAVAKEKGAALASGLVAKFGLPILVAEGLLILGWFFLAAVSLDASIFGKVQFTFWQVLGFLNASNILEALGGGRNPGTGIYGFLAVACLAGPFLAYFWKDKRAHLGALLPLAFMLIVALMVRSNINSAFGAVSGTGSIAEMQREAQQEAMKAISLGLGAYLSLLVSLYFAGVGAKKFLVGRASDAGTYQKSQKVTA